MDVCRGQTGVGSYREQLAVSAAMAPNALDDPELGRMNVLAGSSGRAATFAQNADQTPLRSRYISTFDT
jgi:hypothetical protein